MVTQSNTNLNLICSTESIDLCYFQSLMIVTVCSKTSHEWSLYEEHPALTRTVCLAFNAGQMSASNDTPTLTDAVS